MEVKLNFSDGTAGITPQDPQNPLFSYGIPRFFYSIVRFNLSSDLATARGASPLRTPRILYIFKNMFCKQFLFICIFFLFVTMGAMAPLGPQKF